MILLESELVQKHYNIFNIYSSIEVKNQVLLFV